MPVSAKDKRAYERKIKGILRDAKRLDGATVGEIQSLAATMRVNIHRLFLDAAEGKLPLGGVAGAMRQAIAAEVEAFRVSAETVLSNAVGSSYELGSNSAGALWEQMASAGITGMPVPGYTAEMVEIARQYSADLVSGVSRETLTAINGELSRAILGEKDPYQAMKAVDTAMGVGRDHGISAKSERIVRTELTRAYNGSHQATMEKLAGELESDERELIKRMWVSARMPTTRSEHLEADGQIVGHDEPFIVGGEELMYPGDPAGSAGNTINCMCQVVQAPATLDDIIAKRERELEEKGVSIR